MNKNAILIGIVALVVGGIIGFYIANASQPSKSYLSESAQMMNNNGSSMMQMGKMMMSSGQMMQQKGQQYKDNDMMQNGKYLEKNGQMMQGKGNEMTTRGSGMMQMMGGGMMNR